MPLRTVFAETVTYSIASYQNFSMSFVLYVLQHVSHKCMCNMYVTSGLLSGSTSVAHFNPRCNTHFGMRIYVVIKIVSYTKIACKESDYRGVLNYHGLHGFTIDCRCTHSISPFYIIL